LQQEYKDFNLTKFAIGFSPTLTNYKGKEVEYALKAFPSERLPEKIKAKGLSVPLHL
jgi:hypothetical protein